MSDRFQGPGYRGYNDPAIAKGFDALGKAFAPPSLADIYAGAKAQEAKQKMQGIAAMYGLAQSGDTSDLAKTQFDRYNAATGSGNMSTGYYGADSTATTARRGQDITSTDNRYHTDVGASTSRANNTDDNRTKTDIAMLSPVGKDHTRFVPPDLAGMYKVPGTQTGIVEAKQGEKNYMPDGRVLEGGAKPLTDAEMKGKILGDLPQEAQNRVVTGQHPAQIYNYKGPDGKGGSAVFDPNSGGFVDSQTRQALPPGIALQSAGAPAAQVNIDSTGAQYAAPEKGFAYVRDADGKLKLGANGAPMLAPMEGGPEFAKVKKAGDAETKKAGDESITNDIMSQDLDRALSLVQKNPALTTGIGSQVLGKVGNTDAHDLQSLLTGLKSNITLDRLGALRDSSPTGAALGRVTNQEVNMLAAAHGSLEQSQNPAQLADNLKRLKNLTLDTVHGKGQGPAREPLSFEQDAPTATNPKTGEKVILKNGQWTPAQ